MMLYNLLVHERIHENEMISFLRKVIYNYLIIYKYFCNKATATKEDIY
jgi:hypothetical protein